MIVEAAHAGREALDLGMLESALADHSPGHLDHVVSAATARVGEVLRAKLPALLGTVVGDAGVAAAMDFGKVIRAASNPCHDDKGQFCDVSGGGGGGASESSSVTDPLSSGKPSSGYGDLKKSLSQEHENAKLTKGEHTAFRRYTGDAHAGINSKLRKGGELNANTQKMQDAINRTCCRQEPITVYRAVGALNEGHFPDGATVEMKGFHSTTIDPKIVRSFGESGVILELKTTYGLYLEPLSKHGGEQEVLLPHKLRFKITGKKTVTIGKFQRTVVMGEVRPPK